MAKNLKIAFIGAGQVNFGGGEGPWDHATRLEKIAINVSLTVVGIADPFVQRAQQVLEARLKNVEHQHFWKDSKIFADYIEMLDTVHPDAVFIGTPPLFHGSTISPRDIEIQCANRKIHMFIEKPISCAPIDDVEQVNKALTEAANNGTSVSVGYMFRYSKAVLKMKEIIAKYGPPKAFNARYNCAYSTIAKTEWWDSDKCGGPIVEQATHFCDLARFIVGEVDLTTLQAISLKQTDSLGNLDRVPGTVNEELIPPNRRLPRVTSAFWKFESGAIGSLMHGALLHEVKYESELEVWGDGYRLVLMDPYAPKCILSVRLPGSEQVELLEFVNDDYYLTEDLVFVESILRGNSSLIQSPYSDSIRTYKMTVAIREAALK